MSAVDVAKLWELLPSRETLDAVDDDLLSGRRPCPLYVTINDVRALHKALDALAASERDAARYRWLKAEGIVRVHPMVTRAGSRIFADGSNVPGNFTYVIDGKVSDLDTAIDTAMPQEPDHE